MLKRLTKKLFCITCLLVLLTGNLDLKTSGDNAKPDQSEQQQLNQLEFKTFGIVYPGDEINKRLNRLEDSVYGKISASSPPDDRLKRLNKALNPPEGKIPQTVKEEIDREVAKEEKLEEERLSQEANNREINNSSASSSTNSGGYSQTPQTKVTLLPNLEELSKKTLQIINQERSFRNLAPLSLDTTAQKISIEHASYLIQTKQFSHFGVGGKNPDQRFSEANGTGKIEELIDGFFAEVNEKGELQPIDVSSEVPNQLMDAILKVPDKADIIFSNDANQAGISFVLDPNKKQLVVVVEIITNYVNLAFIPQKNPPSSIPISGSLQNGFKLAWIGIARKDFEQGEHSEVEPSAYFAPIDKVVYLDKTADRAKSIAKTGGMILAMVAAPFTYGASMLVADLLMQSIAQTYQAQDVEVRQGVRADMDGNFNGNINVGEWGAGLYYVSIWAYQGRSKKPIVVGRRTVSVS